MNDWKLRSLSTRLRALDRKKAGEVVEDTQEQERNGSINWKLREPPVGELSWFCTPVVNTEGVNACLCSVALRQWRRGKDQSTK